MSQPFADISVTEADGPACVLDGYPTISVSGHRGFPTAHLPPTSIQIRTRHLIYERIDPGPTRVLLHPGHPVFFSVGTVDAYDGPLDTLTRLTVTLPGARRAIGVPVSLLANGPPGEPLPLGITALTVSPRA